jgi:hypothetical protein
MKRIVGGMGGWGGGGGDDTLWCCLHRIHQNNKNRLQKNEAQWKKRRNIEWSMERKRTAARRKHEVDAQADGSKCGDSTYPFLVVLIVEFDGYGSIFWGGGRCRRGSCRSGYEGRHSQHWEWDLKIARIVKDGCK